MMTPGTVIPFPGALPQPVSAQMDKALTDAVAKVPANKARIVSGAVTTLGVEGTFGWRGRAGSASIYAGKAWGRGWAAGARGSWAW